MKNAIQEGNVLKHTAASAISAGDVIVLPSRIGIAMVDIANGEEGSMAMEGVFELDAETGVAWAQGDTLYWDATNSRLTKTSTSNTLAGYAAAVKASATATGRVKLQG